MKDDKIFARGFPKSCKIVETYSYRQEISKNPLKESSKAPDGEIEIMVPYDGDRHFPNVAYQDVLKQGDDNSNENEAQIGHLLLSDFSKVNIENIPDLMDHHGSFPLKIPIRSDTVPKDKLLGSDCYSAEIKHRYLPQEPEFMPINIDMKLYDEEQISSDPKELEERLINVTKEITHQVEFKRHLFLELTVSIDIPSELVSDGLTPRISSMSLTWPNITSFQMLELKVDENKTLFTYNPVSKSLEWKDINSKPGRKLSGVNVTKYTFPSMNLAIRQPGELYSQDSLEARAEIELPGLLLSGMKVRSFDALGKWYQEPQPELMTKIIGDSEMILGDAFALRLFFPCLHLHFDEVIPDDMRLANILTALSDRDFETIVNILIPCNSDEFKRFIFARRHEGPNPMHLWITVDGKRFITERQVQQEGQKFTRTMDSGFMKIYIKGSLKGDSETLIREMNIIQSILHDRFEPVKAKS